MALATIGRKEDTRVMPVAIAKAMERHGAMHRREQCVRKQVALRKDTCTVMVVVVVDNEEETAACSIHKLRMASSCHPTFSAEETDSSSQRLHLYHEDHRESIDRGALRFSFAKRISHPCHVLPRRRHVVHVPAPLPPISLPSLPPFVSWLRLHVRTCPTHVGTRFEAPDRPNLPSGCASPSKTRRHVALQLVSTKTNNCCTNTSMGNQTKKRWTGTHERLTQTTSLACLKVPNTWRSLPREAEALHGDLAMHCLTKKKQEQGSCMRECGGCALRLHWWKERIHTIRVHEITKRQWMVHELQNDACFHPFLLAPSWCACELGSFVV